MKRYATLREAVKASVNSGIDGAVFSVFDITQMLRNGCNYGNIVIEECQTSYPTFTVDFKKNVKYHYDDDVSVISDLAFSHIQGILVTPKIIKK